MTNLLHARPASTPEMLAIFSEEALLRSLCRFEAALADAQAQEGIIPSSSAAVIAEVCKNYRPDIALLAEQVAHAGTLAIPVVNTLRTLISARDRAASAHFHLATTSQDVADTALVLQAKEAVDIL